ncbi:hypothetical protein BD626DRAFT_628022 [Schizophyllum amplum]|uniref:Uncharacterized protein n=1 Tax=Schizophyllum amplum TaxID=97359 RepID=A0A550CMQ5_9AGAR|nr:hypothetical protein BD626DRAFT_628022 [Auriculariopsis ampla]
MSYPPKRPTAKSDAPRTPTRNEGSGRSTSLGLGRAGGAAADPTRKPSRAPIDATPALTRSRLKNDGSATLYPERSDPDRDAGSSRGRDSSRDQTRKSSLASDAREPTAGSRVIWQTATPFPPSSSPTPSLSAAIPKFGTLDALPILPPTATPAAGTKGPAKALGTLGGKARAERTEDPGAVDLTDPLDYPPRREFSDDAMPSITAALDKLHAVRGKRREAEREKSPRHIALPASHPGSSVVSREASVSRRSSRSRRDRSREASSGLTSLSTSRTTSVAGRDSASRDKGKRRESSVQSRDGTEAPEYPYVLDAEWLRWANVRDEPLEHSVKFRHPAPKEDPVDRLFGGKGGTMAGFSAANTNLLRNALIRWLSGTINFDWGVSLDDECLTLSVFDISREREVIRLSGTELRRANEVSYKLQDMLLLRIGRSAVAVQQVLDALLRFGGRPPQEGFSFDRGHVLLRSLQRSASRSEVATVAATLCYRFGQARTHIRDMFGQLQYARLGYVTKEFDVTGEVESTAATLREQYGEGTVRQVLARYAARDDYNKMYREISPVHARHLEEEVTTGRVQVPTVAARLHPPASRTPQLQQRLMKVVRESSPPSGASYRAVLEEATILERRTAPPRLTAPPSRPRTRSPSRDVSVPRRERSSVPSRDASRLPTERAREEPRPRTRSARPYAAEAEIISAMGYREGDANPVMPGMAIPSRPEGRARRSATPQSRTDSASSRRSSLRPDDSISAAGYPSGGPLFPRERSANRAATHSRSARPDEGRSSQRREERTEETNLNDVLTSVAMGRGLVQSGARRQEEKRDPPPHLRHERDSEQRGQGRARSRSRGRRRERRGRSREEEADGATRPSRRAPRRNEPPPSEPSRAGSEARPGRDDKSPPSPPSGGDERSKASSRKEKKKRRKASSDEEIEFKVKTTLNISELPQWDGKNLMEYIAEISVKTLLGRAMRAALPKALPQRWTGDALEWFMTMRVEDQLELTQSLNALIMGIKDHYMTVEWVNDRTYEFEMMRFRQRGRERETPEQFLRRRFRYIMFLYPSDLAGATAVGRILKNAPYPWLRHLSGHASGVENVKQMLDRAYADRPILMAAWREALNEPSFREHHHVAEPGHTFRRKFRKEGMTGEVESNEELRAIEEVSGEFDGAEQEDEALELEAHAATSRKPEAPRKKTDSPFRANAVPATSWPKGRTEKGYSFARDDTIRSKRPPRDGCYICTSPLHFAKDCSHYEKWKFLYHINLVESVVVLSVMQQQDEDYQLLLQELVDNDNEVSAYVALAEQVDAVETATPVHSESNSSMRTKDPSFNAKKRRNRPTSASKGKQRATPDKTTIPRSERRRSPRRLSDSVFTAENKRQLPEGYSSLGSRALRIPVCFQTLNSAPKDARLDSGADITLLSEEELLSWAEPPVLKTGMRMKLFHLTGDAKVLGYVRFTMFARTTANDAVKFAVEAYVVRGMKVPLLLGEDFQSAYELGVTRRATGRSLVTIGDSGRQIHASSARDVKVGFNVHYAFTGQARQRGAQRRKAQLRARRYPTEHEEVFAAVDTVLQPGAVHNVAIRGPFEGRSDWLVEKIAIGGMDASLMSAPTTWIDSADAKIPIANPSTRPQYLRAGDVVGYLLDPSRDLDRAKTDAEKARLVQSVEAIERYIDGTLHDKDMESAHQSSQDEQEPIGHAPPPADEPLWGPKTSELPPEIEALRDIDISPDVPADRRPQIEDLLQRHARAFGIDGRLGDVPAEVPIKTVPEAIPSVQLVLYHGL